MTLTEIESTLRGFTLTHAVRYDPSGHTVVWQPRLSWLQGC